MNPISTQQRPIDSVDFASAGPGTVTGTLLRKFWQPVYVSRMLPARTMKPLNIMGERFTLYRGESGTAYVVGFRCAHRNMQLSPGWVRGETVQCFYHGWRYDGEGKCIERPGEIPPGPCASVTIPSYPTREHMGLIYAYFGQGEPPHFPPFPAFKEPGIVENLMQEFPCNWFQTFENQVDEVHTAFVHSRGESHKDLARDVGLPDTRVIETEYGFERQTWSGNGPVRVCVYPFPNHMRMIMSQIKGLKGGQGWRDAYLTLVPTDDENHLLFMTINVLVTGEDADAYRKTQEEFRRRLSELPPPAIIAREILDGKYTLDDVVDHPLIPVIEDAVAQLGQGPVHDRTKEVLGRTDVGVTRLRVIYERELRALREGRPIKDWRTYDGQQTPTPGF